MTSFVSRAGQKLDHALTLWAIDVRSRVCADLGCSTGGFVDCLLQHGAGRVYAVDTGYGVLDWKLRKDPRVVVMERINAMHARFPEKISLLTIDVGWTRQRHILPAAAGMLADDADVVTLIKPHYEAQPSQLRGGVLPLKELDTVFASVAADVAAAGFDIKAHALSPIKGTKGNTELLAWLRRAGQPPARPV